MESNKEPSARQKKHGYSMVFGLLIELCIVAGAVLWVAYGYLPHVYYLPVSFASICVVGIVAFFALEKRVKF
jgi:hypothetical protein